MADLFVHIKTTVADKVEAASYVKSLQELVTGSYDSFLYEFRDAITDADLSVATQNLKLPILPTPTPPALPPNV